MATLENKPGHSIETRILSEVTSRGGIPLYYVESGSRLWGMASEDSDFDVRGIHLSAKADYFDYRPHPTLINVSDGLFDFVSYDLDRFLGMVAKNNPSGLEWLRAGQVYLNRLEGFDAFCAAVFPEIDCQALFRHYLSLAKNHLIKMEEGSRFTYKVTLYGLRGLLSADVIRQGLMPELSFEALITQSRLSPELLDLARQCLEIKRTVLEKTPVRNPEEILVRVQEGYRNLAESTVENTGNAEALQRVLTEHAITWKESLYCKGASPS